jgi:hypothetical protein
MTTRVQFRLTYQDEKGNGNEGALFAAGNTGFTNGRDFINFRVRRAKTSFSGHIFEKEFKYNATLSWASGANIVEVASFTWAPLKVVNVSAGQHKLAYNWEEMVSSGSQQFVERSYTNEVFNLDFAKGVWASGRVGEDVPWLKYWAGVYNGVTRNAADFRNADQALRGDTFANGTVDGELMLNARVETHPLGEVKGMNDMRGEDDRDKPLFAIGLAINWMAGYFDNANLRPDTAGAATGSGRTRTSHDTVNFTADGHFRFFGLSVDLAIFYRHTEFHNHGRNRYDPTAGHAGIGDLQDFGFTAEVAFFILPKRFNVGLRWNYANMDEFWMNGADNRPFGLRPDTHELGLSVNYYFHGDNLKLTLDILYVSQQLTFNPDADAAGGTQAPQGIYNTPPQRSAISFANDVSDYNDLWLIRLQLQWVW